VSIAHVYSICEAQNLTELQPLHKVKLATLILSASTSVKLSQPFATSERHSGPNWYGPSAGWPSCSHWR